MIANIGLLDICGASLLDMSNGLPPPVSSPEDLFFTAAVGVALAAAEVVPDREAAPPLAGPVSVDNGEGVGSGVGVSVGRVTGSTAELVVLVALVVPVTDCASLVDVEVCNPELLVAEVTTTAELCGAAVDFGGNAVRVGPSSEGGHNASKIFPALIIPSRVFELTITLEHANITAVASLVNCASHAAEQPGSSKSATLHFGIC